MDWGWLWRLFSSVVDHIGGRDADHAVAGFVQGVGFHQKPKQKMLLRI